MTLPAFAAERRAAAPLPLDAAVGRYLLPAWRSAAKLPHAAPAVKRWDGQTDVTQTLLRIYCNNNSNFSQEMS